MNQSAASPLRSPKRPWHPSSPMFVAIESSLNSSKKEHSLAPGENVKNDTTIIIASEKKNGQTSSSCADLVDAIMVQTRLEWNQKILCNAFLPHKERLRSLDRENFPETDMSESSCHEMHGGVIDEIIDGWGGVDSDPFQVPNKRFGDPSLCEIQPSVIDIRDAMLKDHSLKEREVAAFFEGMRFNHTKVNSLQSQLDSLKCQRRAVSMVFTSKTKGPNLIAPRTGVGNVRPSSNDAMAPHLPPRTKSSGYAAMDMSAPKTYEKSLRAMSIARIRSKVDAMSDSHEEQRTVSGFNPLVHQDQIIGKKEDIQKLLKDLEEAEKYQKRLEKQLRQAGVEIAEDIPYYFAKEKVERIANRMAEIGSSNVEDPSLREEYFRLEKEMEKYTTALQLTDEWVQEQEELENQWHSSIASANKEALCKLRRHMPVNVKNISEAALVLEATPNGKHLPKSIAKRFKRTDCLQLLRVDPDDIVRMHPSTLENMRVTGLTLTERRALYCHLQEVGSKWKGMQSDKLTERKWNWFNMMKSNFKENVDAWQKHIDQFGPPGNHPGCSLIGKQCPLRADMLIDYNGDYGFPEDAHYHMSDIKKCEVDNTAKVKEEAQRMVREKKDNDRYRILKRHYNGRVLDVSLASGSCSSMEEALDKIDLLQEKLIRTRLEKSVKASSQDQLDSSENEFAVFYEAMSELRLILHPLAERSGMKVAGYRDGNQLAEDRRSIVEMCLCEEVVASARYFLEGMEQRIKEIGINDGRIKPSLQQLIDLLDEMELRNSQGISRLATTEEKPPRTRKIRTREAIEVDIQKRHSSAHFGASGGGKSGSRGAALFMNSPECRGRSSPGSRGGLLAAIAARGKIE